MQNFDAAPFLCCTDEFDNIFYNEAFICCKWLLMP